MSQWYRMLNGTAGTVVLHELLQSPRPGLHTACNRVETPLRFKSCIYVCRPVGYYAGHLYRQASAASIALQRAQQQATCIRCFETYEQLSAASQSATTKNSAITCWRFPRTPRLGCRTGTCTCRRANVCGESSTARYRLI